MLKLFRSQTSFLAEADLQVSERVTGFKEKRGNTEQTHNYDTGSPYCQQPLQRLIRTSGVCWYFPSTFAVSEALAESILAAFCNQYGIQSREIGVGRFHSSQSPLGNGSVNGICLFDNANGSLRLTERLAENFQTVLALAADTERKQGNEGLVKQLETFAVLAQALTAVQPSGHQTSAASATATFGQSESLVPVVATGEKAIYTDSNGSQEVTVLGTYYTPKGLHYHLDHPQPTVRWTVPVDCVEPINGVTRTVLLDVMTGEQKAAA